MTTDKHEAEQAQGLIDLHFEIWNDSNAASRAGKYAQVYTSGIFVGDADGSATGFEQVDALIKRVHSEHAGFIFTPDPISWNHGLGRVTWGYGPKDQPNLVRGEDIFTIENGRIASARVFLNNK